MAERQAPSTTQRSLGALLAEHARVPDPDVEGFVQMAAAVQRGLHEADKAEPEGVTSTTALWAILHEDKTIAEVLQDAGVEQAGLIPELPMPLRAPPVDLARVPLAEDLERALGAAFAAQPSPQTIGRIDVAVAVLWDAEAHGGRLGTYLREIGADVPALVGRLDQLRTGEPPRLSGAAGLYLGFYEALQRSRGPGGGTVDGPNLWSAFGYVAAQRRGTLANVVANTLVRLRAAHVASKMPSAGQRDVDFREPVEPVPLDAMSHVALVAHPVLAAAGRVRDRVEPGDVIRLRHIVAVAIEHGEGPFGPETRDDDLDAVRSDFLAQIDHDAPANTASAWHAYFARTPTATPAGRAVAGLDVDLVDDTTPLHDELQVTRDVETLCDVLAARDAVPPISVGLFGRWGSGKSYFMALMRRRIAELSSAARRAGKEHSSYCTDIVQVTFNAWHYMDADDLWATIAVELFAAIAEVDPDVDARPRAEVVRELEDAERQRDPVDRSLARALSDPRVTQAAASMGLGADGKEALGVVGEVGRSAGHLSAVVAVVRRWPRRRRWSVVALGAAGVVALATLAVLLATGSVSVGTLAAWGTLAAGGLGTAAKWLRSIQSGLTRVNDVVDQLGLKPEEVTPERLETGEQDDEKIRGLREELARIDRLTSTREWLEARAQSTDYTHHFGVISVLRGDLEALARKQREADENRRIILYIDDLDRCEPSRVVEVLQAVHLLLAMPLFVVVVGVDPRWLTRSLQRHYRQILSTDGASRGEDEALTESTPHDYLEKIFQIPFSIAPMQADGFGRLVAAIAKPPTPSPSGGPQPDPEVAAQPAPDADAGAPPDGDGDGGTAAPRPAAAPPTEGAPPAPAPAPPPPTIVVDPPRLQLTDPEVAALSHLAPLIGTPRAAKRLVNLYRLVRAGIADDEITRFVAEAQFRALAIVLAAQVGGPRVSSEFLADLVDGTGGGTIGQRVAELSYAERAHRDGDDLEALRKALGAACVDARGRPVPDVDVNVDELRPWIRPLQRYTFEGALAASAGETPPGR
jgi:hypothetical protein